MHVWFSVAHTIHPTHENDVGIVGWHETFVARRQFTEAKEKERGREIQGVTLFTWDVNSNDTLNEWYSIIQKVILSNMLPRTQQHISCIQCGSKLTHSYMNNDLLTRFLCNIVSNESCREYPLSSYHISNVLRAKLLPKLWKACHHFNGANATTGNTVISRHDKSTQKWP